MFFQSLKHQKSNCVGERLFNKAGRDTFEKLSFPGKLDQLVFNGHSEPFSMRWNVDTWSLKLSPYDFQGMGNESSDHSRNNARKGWTISEFFTLFIHAVEQSCEHAFLVAVRETPAEAAFGTFIYVQFSEPIYEIARPPLFSGHFVPSFEDDERIGADWA